MGKDQMQVYNVEKGRNERKVTAVACIKASLRPITNREQEESQVTLHVAIGDDLEKENDNARQVEQVSRNAEEVEDRHDPCKTEE